MSEKGYWQHDWMNRAIKAGKNDAKMHEYMVKWGYTFDRKATNREDQKDKWDYLWISKDGYDPMFVDYKCSNGVQESHKILWEANKLCNTHYLRMFAGRIQLITSDDFWSDEKLTRRVNRGGQVYYTLG